MSLKNLKEKYATMTKESINKLKGEVEMLKQANHDLELKVKNLTDQLNSVKRIETADKGDNAV